MKKQKILQTEAKKADKATESLDNIDEKVENTDDIELTEDQLDVVSGGAINPAVYTGENDG